MKTSNTFYGNRKLSIEMDCNCPSMQSGYTIWHVVNKERKRAISRRADGKDLDFFTDQQIEQLEKGKINFSVSADLLSEYFDYMP